MRACPVSADSNQTAREHLTGIYRAAIAAVDPARLIRTALEGRSPATQSIPAMVASAPRVFLLAIGKAARAMALEAERHLSDRIVAALAVVPQSMAQAAPHSKIRFVPGTHPIPDARSEAAADAALLMLAQAWRDDLVIIALSGGASAMFVKPADGITLADKIAMTEALLRAGAPIRELNLVRKHLSAVKGGQLLLAMNEARVITLVLSDVPGNDLATIGSGVTTADATIFADAIAVLKRRKVWGRAPEAIRQRFERGVAGEVGETIKAGDPLLERVTNVVIGDNDVALAAAETKARDLGYSVVRGATLKGEADDLGRALAGHFASVKESRVCVILGGEPVVTVRGSGKGGRAQQMALALAVALGECGNQTMLAALSAGTDGIDGPTDAAGAFIFGDTLPRAQAQSIDAVDAQHRCDAYNFFHRLGDLFVTRPTGTNVSDIFIGLLNF
jgi:glycerate 2-kinase